MKKIIFGTIWVLFAGSLSAQSIRDHRTGNGWKLLPGSDAKDVAVSDIGIIYMVNTAGKLYHYTGSEWQLIENSNLATYAAYGSFAIKVYKNGLMAQTTGGSPWFMMEGSDARDIAINTYISYSSTNKPETHANLFMVNSAGKIYKYYVHWGQIPGSDAARIALGADQLWMVNTVGKIYRLKDIKNVSWGWQQMPGSDGRDITVTKDGKVWLVNSVGKVYQWYGTGWAEQLDISGGYRIAA